MLGQLMALLKFPSRNAQMNASDNLGAFLRDYSIEVMPRTALKVESFQDILPQNTRVYIAHIDGTPIEDMVATAKRLNQEGFAVMPHFPARIIKDEATLRDWIARYQGEANVSQALLLAGGLDQPQGDFSDSMQLLSTGAFDDAGFTNLHVAGHPEGNRDIDHANSTANVDAALNWKQEFSKRTDAQMAIATQFCFESKPVIAWAEGLAARGIDLPIHIGIAGPAKLQTMIKFAIACGVGPSLRVLQRRAKDVTKLVMPFEPHDILNELADYTAENPNSLIKKVHFFPLGGIKNNATWATENGGAATKPAALSV